MAQTNELYSHLSSYLPQAQRYKRTRPPPLHRSTSSTINELMAWSIVDYSVPILFPAARRRSSEPMPSSQPRKGLSALNIPSTYSSHMEHGRRKSYDRQDSAIEIEKQHHRPKIAVIIAGPENSREGYELKGLCDVTTININSRQHNCSLTKRSPGWQKRSLIPELHACEYFLVRVRATTGLDGVMDTARVESALRLVAQYAQPGTTVVLETAIAVGTTRRLLEPLSKRHHLLCGFSPANATSPHEPRIIAGFDDFAPGSFDSMVSFYETLSPNLIPLSTVEVAEMTALYAGEHPNYITESASRKQSISGNYADHEEMFSALSQIEAFYSPVEQF